MFKNGIIRVKQIASYVLEGHTNKEASIEFCLNRGTIKRDLVKLYYIDESQYKKVRKSIYRVCGAILNQNISEEEAYKKFNMSEERYKKELKEIATDDRILYIRVKTKIYNQQKSHT